jgi:hypothetical protein
MTTVSTKDPHLLSFRQIMEGYLVPILHKVGQRRKEIMISTLKMIKPGYFLLTIPHNSKSLNHNMRYTIITTAYVGLEMDMI